MTVGERLFSIVGIATLLCVSTRVASAQCGAGNPFTCTSSGAVTLNDPSGNVMSATPYPSNITGPAAGGGLISTIIVTLNGLNADANGNNNGLSSLGILLVHGSTALELMSSPADALETFGNVSSPSNKISFVISDAAVAGISNAFGFMPTAADPGTAACGGGTALPFTPPGSGGTLNPSSATILDYRPTSYNSGTGPTSYTGVSDTIIRSGPPGCLGSGTLNGVFGGQDPTGTWSLYVVSTAGTDVNIESWSLTIATSAATASTTTLNSSVNPSFTASPSNLVTLTATVTSTGGTVNAGTVAFKDGTSTIAGCGTQSVTNGSATCVNASFTTQGFHSLSAVYSGGGGFGVSTGTLNQFVEFHSTSPTTNQFCNTGGISIPVTNASGTDTQPYPSVVIVSGISASTVSTVSLVLNNFTMSETLDISMLLVSPDGIHSLDFFDLVGGGNPTSGVTATFADGGIQAPNGSGGLSSTTYEATSFRSSTSNPPPSFLNPPSPAPQVPGTFNNAAPGGGTSAKTFLQAFNGATSNGAWSLYFYDHSNLNTSSVGSWCLNVTPGAGAGTNTVVSGSPNAAAPNGAAPGTSVTVTAAVKSNLVGVTKGSVTFTENGVTVPGGGNISVATSGPTQGQASFSTSTFTEGDHTILATYTDSTNGFSESFGTYVQRVDAITGVTVNGTEVSYCNASKITIPGPNNPSDLGAAFPNPSNINVSNLFGTIKTVTVSLNGYSEGEPEFLTSLLVGAGTNLDFFSGAGGPNPGGPFNLTFADSASSMAPNGPLNSGTFKPTSFDASDSYTASQSGFYTLPLPGAFNYSPSTGVSTFASIFANKSPVGNWDLYLNQTGNNPGGAINAGWCLNFAQNPPVLTISKSHAGNFVQGQQGAQFTITVNNTGPGSAGGAIGIAVADTMPIGLTPVSGSGTGWNCPAPIGQTINCTNANIVASGSSFPVLTLNVNVATSAPPSVNNTASVNGSGNTVAVNSNTDPVTIVAAPVLAISKSPAGTFTQGQTATWNVVVTNTAAANSTTSGTVTVVDTLPTGYSLSSSSGTGWTCGAVTVTVTCTSTTTVSGVTSYPTLGLTVSVPANSPTSVTNNGVAFGGGDLTHTNSGNGATTFSTVTVTQVPATVNLTNGNNQSAAINTAFTTNLSVTVLDAGSVAINGATVTFTAPPSGASGTFAGGTNVKTATTNSAGLATATTYTTNTLVGGPYNINVGAGSATNHFSATNLAGAASSMTANTGTTPQSATINTAFTNALAVTVKDAGSNPLSGVNVTFTAPGSGASGLFSNSTTTITVSTNASGVASAPFTANGTAGGSYNVTAASTGLTTVNFSLTNTAGTAALMTANAGTTPQSATINTAFATALAVTVKDAGSNPLSGVNVTFTAPGSGASGLFSNSTTTITVSTNASGIASAPFTANGTAGGQYMVTASSTGLTAVNFSLTNTAGAPASMTANAGTTPQSAAVNTAFATALAVTVKDAGSNPLSGVNVTFTAPGSGSSGLFANSTTIITVPTNASGIASAPFTANGTPGGPYAVTASSSGLTAVNFSLTNIGSAAMVTNVSSTTANGTYGVGATIPITVTFSKAVNVTGTPLLALNSGGTAAYTSGSGTSTLTFVYTVAAGQSSAHLDYTSISALTLNGGSIIDASSIPAMLGLPAPGTAGSLGANKNLVIDTVSPTVVAYNVLWGAQSFNVVGSARNRLPWQITGIQVVFSKPIAAGTVNSLSGVTTTGFSGLGTTTLTWTVSPLALGNFATMLAGSGPNALTDAGGNGLAGGAGFSQNLKILYGDFNDDGVVNSQDLGAVQAAINQPYNVFADLNGDGAVTILDYTIVRSRLGTSLP